MNKDESLEIFRRKTDILYWNPVELMELAKNGGLPVAFLQEALIYMKRPDATETRVIRTIQDTYMLVIKILEAQAEVIDYAMSPGQRNGYDEELITNEEVVKRKYDDLKQKMELLLCQHTETVDPNNLDIGDILVIDFCYDDKEKQVKFSIAFLMEKIYCAKMMGECFISGAFSGIELQSMPFSMFMTDKIFLWWSKSFDIFQGDDILKVHELVRSGLNDRYITEIQIWSKEQKKIERYTIIDRLFNRRK